MLAQSVRPSPCSLVRLHAVTKRSGSRSLVLSRYPLLQHPESDVGSEEVGGRAQKHPNVEERGLDTLVLWIRNTDQHHVSDIRELERAQVPAKRRLSEYHLMKDPSESDSPGTGTVVFQP